MPVTILISVLAAVLLVAAAPAPANAQAIDLAAVKCKEFLEFKQDRIGFILMWLEGYYTADEDPVVVDFDHAKSKADKLNAYCAKNPTLNVITAAESVLGKP
jgi:acid stress chaperone HdeB